VPGGFDFIEKFPHFPLVAPNSLPHLNYYIEGLKPQTLWRKSRVFNCKLKRSKPSCAIAWPTKSAPEAN